jgi:hypothetical protein
MKVTHENVEGFRPFTLNIVVENEEEAKALYAIFSYAPNMTRLPNGCRELREAIRECVGSRWLALEKHLMAEFGHTKPAQGA